MASAIITKDATGWDESPSLCLRFPGTMELALAQGYSAGAIFSVQDMQKGPLQNPPRTVAPMDVQQSDV